MCIVAFQALGDWAWLEKTCTSIWGKRAIGAIGSKDDDCIYAEDKILGHFPIMYPSDDHSY